MNSGVFFLDEVEDEDSLIQHNHQNIASNDSVCKEKTDNVVTSNLHLEETFQTEESISVVVNSEDNSTKEDQWNSY